MFSCSKIFCVNCFCVSLDSVFRKVKGRLEVLTVWIESNCNTWFTGTQHLSSIEEQWRYTDESIGCKNFSRTSFSSTETSSLIPSYHFFHMDNWHDYLNFISFLWMETGCTLGSPDKFENDKLYSNATRQQNERQVIVMNLYVR